MHFTIRIDQYFQHKVLFRANLKIDVTKNRIFRGISWVKLKSEIHSPGNFLLVLRQIYTTRDWSVDGGPR